MSLLWLAVALLLAADVAAQSYTASMYRRCRAPRLDVSFFFAL